MRVLTVKSGDKYPTLWMVPMDLTNSTVRLIAKNKFGAVSVLATTIKNAADGIVEHVLTGTLAPGEYRVELEITRGSEVITAPTDGYENLKVIPDLD